MNDDGTDHRPQGGHGRAHALPRLHQPVPVHAAADRRPPLIATERTELRRPGSTPGRFAFVQVSRIGHGRARSKRSRDGRFERSVFEAMPEVAVATTAAGASAGHDSDNAHPHPPRRAPRHPRNHPHLRPCGAARHGVVRARAAGRGRDRAALRRRCTTAASRTSWRRSTARSPAMPMPGPIARGRPIVSPSRIRSTSIRQMQRRGVGRALLERLLVKLEKGGFRQMIAVIGDSDADAVDRAARGARASGWSAPSRRWATNSAAGSTAC